MFCLALLVSDPKATSRCLQSLGRAALSVKRTAEIPVCQFKWHSPSSNACIFKSTAKCGKQGTHSYPLWKEHVSGAGKQGNALKRKQCRVDFSCYYPILICWLFHLLLTCLPVHVQPGRLQSVCCRRTASLEKKVPICLVHLRTVEVCIFCSAAMQALHIHLGQDLHSSRV